MADFLLTVGIDPSLSYAEMEKGIRDLVNQLNRNTPRVQIAFDESSLNNMRRQIDELSTSIRNIGAINPSSGRGANTSTQQYRDATKAIREYYSALTTLNKSKSDVELTHNGWQSASGNYKELANTLNRTKTAFDLVTNSMHGMPIQQQAQLQSLLTSEVNKYNLAMEKEANDLRTSIQNEKLLATVRTTSSAALTQGQTALRNWTKAQRSSNESSVSAYKAIKIHTEALEHARNAYDGSIDSAKNLRLAENNLRATLKTSGQIIKENGDATKTLGDRVGGLAKKFTTWFGVSTIIMTAYRNIKKMVSAVIELDTAMTELKKVTNETDATYEKFLDRAAERAKKLGSTMSDIVSATSDFARLGYSIDEAEKLADAATVYKNVGDGIDDINAASESIIATMQAFGLGAEDAMLVVDKFNEVGNNYAISSKGVGDALLRSAAAMHSANNTLDETIALAAAANTVVQDPDKVGTTLKTVSMYLRAAKTEAEEAGESTDGMAESVSELREELYSLTGKKIDIQADDNTFKSTYQILKELSEVWHELSDISQANILEIVGGKRNANVVSAILENFTIANDAIETSKNSANSALEENEKVLLSIQGRISIFKATFEELSKNLIGSELIKNVIDLGTWLLTLLNSIVKLCDGLGGLRTALLGTISVLLIFKANAIIDCFKSIIGFIPSIISKIKNLRFAWNMYQAAVVGSAEATAAASALMQASIPVLGIFLAAITAVVGGISMYNSKQEESRREMIETGKEVAKLTEDLDGLVEQYRKLGEDGNLDNSDREQAYNIQQQINELLGDEVEYINLSNGEYKEQLELLKKLQHEKANDNYSKFKDAKDAAEKNLKNKAYGSFGDSGNYVNGGAWTTEKENEAITNLLKTNGMTEYIGGENEYYGGSFEIDMSSADAIVKSYENMIKLRNILSKSYQEEIKNGGVLKDFYNDLDKKISDMSDSVQEYKDAMSSYNINEAVIQFNEKEFGGIKGALIDSEEAMGTWMNKMISSKKVTDGVQAELIALAQTWYPQYITKINEAINAEATKIIQDTLVDKSLSGNVESLKYEATALGLTESAMMSLVLAEINFNKNNLNVSQKISALKELATWAGVAQVKMDSIFGANSKSKMADKRTWAERNGVTINEHADKDGTHTYTYNGKTYTGVNAVNEVLLNEAIQSQIDSMNNVKIPTSGATPPSSKSDSSSKSTSTFDWIETALSRIQRTINNLGKTVSATWKSWTERNKALKEQMSGVRAEISLQQDAYNKYMSLANSVSLGEGYKQLVRNGAMDISIIADEDLAKQINLYKEYYEAALNAYDAKIDLENELANLVQTEFDNTTKRYDDELSMHEHQISMLESSADILETRGYMVGTGIYDALIQQENARLTDLKNKYASLESILNSSSITKYSEQWYAMQLEILGVREEIQNTTNALEEYDNTLQEIGWNIFDKLQEKISAITTEANFLIDLMSDEKMFNDDGSTTKHGQATLGLHALNYNTYMAQADEYATELQQINAELANDPYNQTLLERRDELLEQQRDMILAAEDEKQVMKDLMSDGYDALLGAMDNIISKRKEMLSQIKDLYDYEKSIAEQTADVTKYQKLVNSVRGMTDTEEGRAALQKYEVSLKEAQENLEETEYEKYISDQEQMLDSLYDKTEEWINSRLDDLGAVIQDVIASTNENANEIKTTLTEEAKNVGTTLTAEMEKIWSTNGTFTQVVSTYSQDFSKGLTTVNGTLISIKELIAKMVKDAEDKAAAEAAAANPPAQPAPAPAPSTPATSTGTGSSGNSSWGSWFISKTDSYPKSQLKTETSIVDRLKYRNIDSSLSARSSYYAAMGGSGAYTGSSQQNQWMIAQMKAHGFTDGGTIGRLIRASGEDGFILAKTGEEILSLEKIKALGESFSMIYPVVDALSKLPDVSGISTSNLDRVVQIDIGDIQMYGVNDPESFARQLKESMLNNSSIRKIMKDTTIGEALGRNSMIRYTR